MAYCRFVDLDVDVRSFLNLRIQQRQCRRKTCDASSDNGDPKRWDGCGRHLGRVVVVMVRGSSESGKKRGSVPIRNMHASSLRKTERGMRSPTLFDLSTLTWLISPHRSSRSSKTSADRRVAHLDAAHSFSPTFPHRPYVGLRVRSIPYSHHFSDVLVYKGHISLSETRLPEDSDRTRGNPEG